MTESYLAQAAVFLAAAAIAAPIAKRLKIGSVLGYMAAGVLIGPFGLGFVYEVYEVESILHFAELGVVLLLFLIGLELRPARLWTMRKAIFGAGGTQMLASALLIMGGGLLFGLSLSSAAIIGLALALSSTAFVLQVLEEKGELTKRHGRLGFSILLFQDLAAIPIIASVPFFAVVAISSDHGEAVDPVGWTDALIAIGVIGAVIVLGRYVLGWVYKLVAASGVREAMTASALLTVVGVSLLMQAAGMSAALGAFLAGALLADSAYRHQIEADLAPFEGLLLGLFFTAIGMLLNVQLLFDKPLLILGLVALLLGTKAAVLFVVGRAQGLDNRAARRLALAVSQGGEFAFVVFTTALGAGVLARELTDLLTVVVTLSMVATPLLLILDDLLTPSQRDADRAFDDMPDEDQHVVIAGFGRYGQIVARILNARGIPFTALDASPDRVDLARAFGNTVYYGDTSRIDILEAAQTGKARAFVLAVGGVDPSLKTAEVVRKHFPNVPIHARARDRQHVYQLKDAGVEEIRRETFRSALATARGVLKELGLSPSEARRIVGTFAKHDRQRLHEDYEDYTNNEKMQARAQEAAAELRHLIESDEEQIVEDVAPADASGQKPVAQAAE
ncbi:MAG: monovalent cation:proton antiporter-2 (CPA2) family protein [Pseudomonadota bacterium]